MRVLMMLMMLMMLASQTSHVMARHTDCRRDKDETRNESTDESENDEWVDGVMTYYTVHEGGPQGAGGKKLKPFRSVAVPSPDFSDNENRRVKIRGYGTFRVDDACDGRKCKDFDVFVGEEEDKYDLENWELGEIPIRYKWV